MNKRILFLFFFIVLGGCASRPCAYIALGEKMCLAPLPTQTPFRERNEMVVASSDQGPLTALAQAQWDERRYSSAVTTLFGQRLYVLHYDGQQIQFEQSELPLPIRAENVMLDTQLMWWPLALLQAQLPTAARLNEYDENGARVRELWWNNVKRVRVVYQRDGNAEIINYQQFGLHYQLLLKELARD